MVTGILVIVHTPPTKSGKRVIFITMEDETGLIDVVVFPKAQIHYAEAIFKSEALTVEGRLHRQGKLGLSTSIVMDRLVMPWTGKLSSLIPRHRAYGMGHQTHHNTPTHIAHHSP
jgi:DNA polymerase III alpha subunit